MRITAVRLLKFGATQSPPSNYANKMPPLPQVSQLVKLYQVKAAKYLSQNFLYDPKIIDRFVSYIGNKRQGDGEAGLAGQYVCEIGPGPGSISRSIMQRNPEQLMVVEKDHRFLTMLRYLASICGERLQIVHGDILQFDLLQAFPAELAQPWSEDSPPFTVCGNLPFNISLPLMFKFLDDISLKQNMFTLGRVPMVFTFQHEVGQRLVAKPGDHQRCRVSVTSQFYSDVSYKFKIGGGSFVPAPKVDVAVMKLVPKKEFITHLPFKTVDFIIKHCMHNRNKKCYQGVRTLFPRKRSDLVDEMFRISAVDPTVPGSMLDNLHYRDLCHTYEGIADRIPQLRLVDSYDPKAWLKHFDENGDPLQV